MRVSGHRHARRRAALVVVVIGLCLGGCSGGSPATTLNADTLDVLSCHDSPGQQAIDTAPARLVNGVDGFIGDANAYDSLPVQYVGGHRYLAWKTALAVAASARPYRTVSVVRPASARLGYARANDAAPPSRRVRLPVCGDRYTLYVGRILVRHPACVTLAVTGPAPAEQPVLVTVPVLAAQC